MAGAVSALNYSNPNGEEGDSTSVTGVRAYGEDGKVLPGFVLEDRTKADEPCQRSLRTRSPETYRCFGINHVVYDPCWINLQNIAACLTTPWSKKVSEIENAHPGPRGTGGAIDTNTFWGLELANGERCQFAPGATSEVEGERIDYKCGTGVVAGDPDRSAPKWTVLYAEEGSHQIETVAVIRVWR